MLDKYVFIVQWIREFSNPRVKPKQEGPYLVESRTSDLSAGQTIFWFNDVSHCSLPKDFTILESLGRSRTFLSNNRELAAEYRRQQPQEVKGLSDTELGQDLIEIYFFQKYYKPEPAAEPIRSGGWLSPTGAFYPCDYREHDGLARELAINLYWVISGCTRRLEQEGWLRFYDSGELKHGQQRHPDLTNEQVQKIRLMAGIAPPGSHWRNNMESHLYYHDKKSNRN